MGEISDIFTQIEEQGESVAEADRYNRIRKGISGVKALKEDLDDLEKEQKVAEVKGGGLVTSGTRCTGHTP